MDMCLLLNLLGAVYTKTHMRTANMRQTLTHICSLIQEEEDEEEKLQYEGGNINSKHKHGARVF
jgi:hypothetical protein